MSFDLKVEITLCKDCIKRFEALISTLFIGFSFTYLKIGIEKTPHHTETLKNENKTASVIDLSPKNSGL